MRSEVIQRQANNMTTETKVAWWVAPLCLIFFAGGFALALFIEWGLKS